MIRLITKTASPITPEVHKAKLSRECFKFINAMADLEKYSKEKRNKDK